MIPANIQINVTFPETRGIVLPDAENCTIVDKTPKRDGMTDRRKWSSQYSGLHGESCGRAVKTLETPTSLTFLGNLVLLVSAKWKKDRWRHGQTAELPHNCCQQWHGDTLHWRYKPVPPGLSRWLAVNLLTPATVVAAAAAVRVSVVIGNVRSVYVCRSIKYRRVRTRSVIIAFTFAHILLLQNMCKSESNYAERVRTRRSFNHFTISK